MNEREARPAELVGEQSVGFERIREDDAVGFAVVETERRPGLVCFRMLIGILDGTVILGGEDVGRDSPANIPTLRGVLEFETTSSGTETSQAVSRYRSGSGDASVS